jgi:hypothetical protein
MMSEAGGHSEFDKWLKQWLVKIHKGHFANNGKPFQYPQRQNSTARRFPRPLKHFRRWMEEMVGFGLLMRLGRG